MNDAASETVDDLAQKQPHIGISIFECHEDTSLSRTHNEYPSFLGTRKVPIRQGTRDPYD